MNREPRGPARAGRALVTLSPLVRRREKVVPGDAGEAGRDGKVRPGPQPLTGFQQLHRPRGLAQRCMKSRVEQGRWVGGETGVSRGMVWWVGLRGEPVTCWRGECQACGQSDTVGGADRHPEFSLGHLVWTPELVSSHGCNK